MVFSGAGGAHTSQVAVQALALHLDQHPLVRAVVVGAHAGQRGCRVDGVDDVRLPRCGGGNAAARPRRGPWATGLGEPPKNIAWGTYIFNYFIYI